MFRNDGDPCCLLESQKQPYPSNQLSVDPHCTDEYLSPSHSTKKNEKQTNKHKINVILSLFHLMVVFMNLLHWASSFVVVVAAAFWVDCLR